MEVFDRVPRQAIVLENIIRENIIRESVLENTTRESDQTIHYEYKPYVGMQTSRSFGLNENSIIKNVMMNVARAVICSVLNVGGVSDLR